MGQTSRPKKLPRNYQVVYDVVSALPKGEHAAAGDIYAASQRMRPGIGYSTVYRALERLRDLSLVLEVRVPGSSSALYEVSSADHAHFRCNVCARIEDVDYAVPAADMMQVAGSHHIAIDGVSVTFNGICAACHAGQPAETAPG